MSTSNVASSALRDVALFRGLEDHELGVLAHQVVRRDYTRQEIIFSQGEPGDGLYVIVDGRVSVSRENWNGDEMIINIMKPGEYFGELALFDDQPRSATATAVDAVSLLFLARPAFRTFLETHPRVAFTCLEVVVRRLRHCTDLIDELALLDVHTRLARRLLWLADQGTVRDNASSQTAPLVRITQQHLASLTGATRESVNKHLNTLVDQGMIRLERGAIVIVDRARLEEAALGPI